MGKGIKKIWLILATVFMLSAAFGNVSYATTLDALTSGGVVVEETSADDTETESYIDSLYGSVDHSEYNGTAENIQSRAGKPVSLLFQMLAYILMVGLTARILVDLIFITVPPFRCLFERDVRYNGMGENIRTGGTPGNGAPGPLGMQAFGNGGPGGMQADYDKYWGVSEAAIRSVEMSKQDSSKSSISFYSKEMFIVCVFTGILIVLALTGVLQQMGFWIGEAVVNLIHGIL